MPLPRLLRTASFRLAALYAALFGGSVLLLGVVVFCSTRSALEDQVRRRIEAEVALLQDEFRSKPLENLVATIQERTRAAANLDYFLVDSAGKRLAGDLPFVPDRLGWVEIDTGHNKSGEQAGENERVRALITQLDGGIRLGVGEDLELVGEMEDTLLGALGSALGIVLVLGIGGGLVLGAGFLRRVDAITRTAEAIIAGDLSRRIERTGSGDDFDRLSATLNAMLDRITGLMENLRQVSSDIAHDLRTPLSRLRQGLEEAKDRDLTAADYKSAVERAVEDADALLGTFSALLRIAQIEAGTTRSGFRAVDLSDVMRTVAEAYAPAAEESRRTVRTHIAEDVQIRGDRELLTQLFANLVENALHHTPPGTTITLRLARQSTAAIADVADDGPVERSRTSVGNGLGLSLVAAIAEIHCATIELLDNHPGLRATIRFSGA